MRLLFLFFFTGVSVTIFGQTEIYDSGGKLMPEQAAYDVTFYDLDLTVDPDNRFIDGTLTMVANIVQPIDWIVVNLDTLLEVESAFELDSRFSRSSTDFIRDGGLIWIPLYQTRKSGDRVYIVVKYNGHPRVAPNPPWSGGFTWSKTPDGHHWIATTCQQEGADVWWPNKDHVSDKPDSMAMHIRVPEPLVVAMNGHLQNVEKHNDNTRTYHWFVSTPISGYNISLNAAPYELIEGELESVAGDIFPVVFYVLPKDLKKGKKLFPEILEHLRFYEKYFGPYPFRADKYGVVQTPHLGMEHQSIIAYGANFNNKSMTRGKDWGFDALHHHELAHEWWGNLVTNSDWRDMWLHEGFGSYMQALYVEELHGKDRYKDFMKSVRRFSDRWPIAPRAYQTAKEIYRAPIYVKGAWVLHSLRYVIGDEAFFKVLRKMAYPNEAMEKIKDGGQTRFATTDDFLYIAEKESGKELDWFFELYLRQPKLPNLKVVQDGPKLHVKWETPNDLDFPMPIEIKMDGVIKKFEIPKDGLTIAIGENTKFTVDPDLWILKNIKNKP